VTEERQEGSAARGSGLSRELQELAMPLLAAQLRHPFVRGIADGSLPPAVFARWVRQDYRYLIEYARVFGLAAARSDRLESMTWFADVLHLTLAQEMELHRRYAARFGISAADLEREPMWPTTRAYTDFLVRVAAVEEPAGVVAALLPCTWGYVELASSLSTDARPRDQRYADWIEQYSAPEFRAAAEWLAAELDRLAAGCGPARRQRLTELFLTSARYELAFWRMCWQGESWPE
jgi:thiaminase/transcriptional activator TenA